MVAAWTIGALWTMIDAPKRPPVGIAANAESFLKKVDMATLPPDTVICGGWMTSMPFSYERLRRHRLDVQIIISSEENWLRILSQLSRTNIYTTEQTSIMEGFTLNHEHGLWRVDPEKLRSWKAAQDGMTGD